MSQKDKVKELVGRGLSSYHTKALQQIERIEKKNKEQNHKISILTGELDKDYITKTAEGSVISLDHSKEGMVYLDELQGNTLVNYCTDGSKEMALNGDIDVEGTFVTTTEGIDNGKVDVMCEGNTLVNLYKSSIPRFSRSDVVNNNTNTYNITTNNNYIKVVGENLQTSNYRYIYFDIAKLAMLKPNTKYTIIFKKCKVPSLTKCTIQRGDSLSNISNNVSLPNGSDRLVLTTKDTVTVDSQGLYIWNFVNDTSLDIEIELTGIIEGDYTNEEIPSKYFEGMKSVGQDDENTHKIEILSHNGNLYKRLENSHYKVYGSTVTIIEENENGFIYKAEEWDMGLSYLISTEGLFKNKKYRLSWERNNNTPNTPLLHSDGIKLLDSNKSFKEIISWDDFDYLEHDFKLPDSFEQGDILEIRFKNGALSVENGACNICINEIGVAKNTVISKLNKKEILINEPLRSTPNTKDRFVKIGNKWFIERNCKQVRLELKSGGLLEELETEDTIVAGIWNYSDKKYHKKNIINHINDTFADVADRSNQNEYIYSDGWNINFFIRIKKSRLTENTLQGVKNWLQNNPINLVYELATPTYEPLELEPVLNTYNDITHISNNSIISCNMKIKNSGYNAIIKPSTLYTVALDTNKSGTIGMDLGGAKVTTINNVATITTPATLSDDSLRLYGKGINGSKVRLLEGDKTNWIPSFFEGMKSSFEDKLQDDGSYKMEILMNNENLLDLSQHSINTPYTNQYKIENNTIFGTYIGDNYTDFQLWFKLKRNKTYKLSWDISSTYILNGANSQLLKGKLNGYNADSMLLNSYDVATGIISNLPCDGWYTLHFHSMRNNQFIKNLQLKLVDISTNFTERKFNKIQFSSIEPLRGVGDFKDKFVFKDGKLMIERNCKVTILDETFNYTNWGNGSQAGYFTCHANNYLQGEFVFNQKNTISKEFTIGGGLGQQQTIGYYKSNPHITVRTTIASSTTEFKEWIKNNNITLLHALAEPTYEEVPFELQKIILEGYENGTLFFDTNIPPTATVTYAGETPIAKATKLNKTEVSNNTADINDNILPYLMDMDYRIVMLQLATEELEGEVSMARLFGRTYEMLKRDILSKRLSRQEYGYRLADYFNAGKLTEEQVRELEELR